MQDFEIEFYKTETGEIPVNNFLSDLEKTDDKMLAKIMREISLLKQNGNELREPHTKPLKKGLFELRAKQGNNISRIIYFFFVGKKIILTNGFIKKTQKTPTKEIKLAEKYKDDYLKRNKEVC